ncbi:alpha/beta fold hydrolase [Streptomyces sp. VRA16 Mangrove soil]|uniref:alpha/beta fold hydrolase n=1 Tax=Streptomyces sp. VRA16 Mangrove soil TaxID=2817434 RepID=UPI001A9F110A|nr:alpha/beta hydrolase [Streptomyces sp. VRA16 Mangrove soil]MBO1332781.1 alpha/beta hydrolase [Streptomyces sp. VRA16 Mangrove soil]
MSVSADHPVHGLPLHGLTGFTHHWVDAGGIRLHAVEGGRPTGPAVVLLAGFPQTWRAWRKVMPHLADRFRVIAIDLPGQGHSERPARGYDTHTVAAHVHAAATALGAPTYWLAAHDIGAWVAFSLALNHESDLHGLALLDAGIPGVTLPDSIPTDPARAWKTWHFAFHLVPDLPETLLADREREYVSWFLRAKALDPGAFDDADLDHYAAALAADGGLSASLAYYRDAAESARRNHEALGRRHLTLPVLGMSSSHGSIPDMAASLGPWADNTTSVVVPDAGHFIPDEQPEAVAAALTGFIAGGDPSGPSHGVTPSRSRSTRPVS